MFLNLFNDGAECMGARPIGIYALLIGGNIVTWLWALVEFHDRPLLLGAAFIGYSFWLRRAFGAEHVAAIYNAARKLMRAGCWPIAVGFFFSLGHSTMVVVLSIAIALAAAAFHTADLVLSTEMDLAPGLHDFEPRRAERAVRELANAAPVTPVPARGRLNLESWPVRLHCAIANIRARLCTSHGVEEAHHEHHYTTVA